MERKNGNDENKTLFTYSYTSLDWTKSYVCFLYSDISTFFLSKSLLILSSQRGNDRNSFYRIYSTLRINIRNRKEGDTRVFYHLERSTKYLARCARRGAIKIVTYYEASEKDVNYACQFKVRLMCHALMEKLFHRFATLHVTKTVSRKRRKREIDEFWNICVSYWNACATDTTSTLSTTLLFIGPPRSKLELCSPVLVSSGVSTIHLIKPQWKGRVGGDEEITLLAEV